MKKLKLKLKIIITNISRIVWSFLFINLHLSYFNRIPVVRAYEIDPNDITCYYAGPPKRLENTTNTIGSNNITMKNVLIILVPVAIVIGIAVLIVKAKTKKQKEEKKEEKENDK